MYFEARGKHGLELKHVEREIIHESIAQPGDSPDNMMREGAELVPTKVKTPILSGDNDRSLAF